MSVIPESYVDYAGSALAVLCCYLAGSVPFGLLVARIVGKIDIRKEGSGNIGATNVGRILGKKWGIFVFFLDYLKGLIPVLLGTWLLAVTMNPGSRTLITSKVLMALAAILGHMFPIFLKFKGGKGASTSAGVLTAVQWQVPLVCFPVWAVLLFATKYMSVASMTAALCVPAVYISIHKSAAFKEALPGTVFCIAIAVLVIYAHRSNIKRLLSGTENKLFQKKASAEGDN